MTVSYLHGVLLHQQTTIAKARSLLQTIDFEAVVGTGVSGIIGATLLSYAMNKKLVIVRKSLSNHSNYWVEGGYNYNTWIFVDDRIDSGETLRRVHKKIKAHNPKQQFVGAYLYDWGKFRDSDYLQEFTA